MNSLTPNACSWRNCFELNIELIFSFLYNKKYTLNQIQIIYFFYYTFNIDSVTHSTQPVIIYANTSMNECSASVLFHSSDLLYTGFCCCIMLTSTPYVFLIRSFHGLIVSLVYCVYVEKNHK